MKNVSGVTSLDLLRQRAEGSGSNGGNSGYSILGAKGADQVRPVGEEQQTGIVNSKTPPGVEEVDTLGNPGSTGGGGDRPD